MQISHFITVIIPTFHDWERLQLCLDALSIQTLPRSNFEIIVVNNDPDSSIPSLSLPSNSRIIPEPRPGSYVARNTAIMQAKGDILAFTDSDCIPYESWLENGLNALLLDKSIQRIGGHIELFFYGEKLSWAEIYEKIFAFPQKQYIEIGYAATANMITFKKCFDLVGLFNDKLMSGGDLEWGRRADAHGLVIAFADDCIVKHPARRHLSDLLKKKKRVTGGHSVIKKEGKISLQKREGGFFSRQRQKIQPVTSRSDLSVREKIICIVLIYTLYLYDRAVSLLLDLGLTKHSRQ